VSAVVPETRTVTGRAIVEPTAHPGRVYVAIVHSPDGVHLATAGVTRAELVRLLADYVRARCGYTLWPNESRYVRTLLARGELEAAVEVYFGRVGDRWDEERLAT